VPDAVRDGGRDVGESSGPRPAEPRRVPLARAARIAHHRARAPRRGVGHDEAGMAITQLVEYEDAPSEVRAVYDDIMATRGTDWVNNMWKALAHHPPTLARVWSEVKAVMAPGGALDPLTKELIYIAVSVTNGCDYCIHSHTAAARAKGMTEAMLGEAMAVIALANQTNRLANGYQVPVDARFSSAPPRSPAS
jgi:AhpD family alkylhydroperoxidase